MHQDENMHTNNAPSISRMENNWVRPESRIGSDQCITSNHAEAIQPNMVSNEEVKLSFQEGDSN